MCRSWAWGRGAGIKGKARRTTALLACACTRDGTAPRQVRFSCSPDLRLKGPPEITCLLNATFDHAPPTCVKCPDFCSECTSERMCTKCDATHLLFTEANGDVTCKGQGVDSAFPIQSCRALLPLSPAPTSSFRFVDVDPGPSVVVREVFCNMDTTLDGGGERSVHYAVASARLPACVLFLPLAMACIRCRFNL